MNVKLTGRQRAMAGLTLVTSVGLMLSPLPANAGPVLGSHQGHALAAKRGNVPRAKNLPGPIVRVESDPSGTPGDQPFGEPLWKWAPDSRRLVGASESSNLVPGDANRRMDLFVKDVVTGSMQLVSTGATGTQANDMSHSAVWSPDGKAIAFDSIASNLTPGDVAGFDDEGLFTSYMDVFVKDLTSGSVQMVSTSAQGEQGNDSSRVIAWSPDGSRIAFSSDATNLVPGVTRRSSASIYFKDLATGDVLRVPKAGGITAWSSDGRRVLLYAGRSGQLLHLGNGARLPLSKVVKPKQAAGFDAGPFSPDGRRILSVRGRQLLVKRVSQASRARVIARIPGRLRGEPSWSPDGKRVLFTVERARGCGVFVVPSAGGKLTRIGGSCFDPPSWSPDGTRVLFTSNSGGVYVRDVRRARLSRIDTSTAGRAAKPTANPYYAPSPTWAPDGKRVLFYSAGLNLVPGPAPFGLPPGGIPGIPMADGGWYAFAKNVG